MGEYFIRFVQVKMPYFQERIVATLAGCITSIQAIYVPADDLTDPAPVVIFGHLDGITVPFWPRATGLGELLFNSRSY